jgi:hypothetical protein
VDKFAADFWQVPGPCSYPAPSTPRELAEGNPGPVPGAQIVIFKQAALPECVLLLPEHRLLVTCDSVQNFERDPLLSVAARIGMWPMGFFKPCVIGPMWLKAVTARGGSLRDDFERVLALDFDNLVSAHGTPKLSGAKAALAKQVSRLPRGAPLPREALAGG